MSKLQNNIVLALLAVGAVVLSLVMQANGLTSWLETAGFLTGILAVWLTAKENIYNFPIGLVNVAIYSYLMYITRFYSDAWLQVVYFVLGVFGWYWWLHGSQERKEIHIVRMPRKEWAPVLIIAVIATAVLTWINVSRLGAAPFWDASLTVLSLVAQYMLTRKYIESWHFWILVDIFYVPLFLWRGLYLTGLLYFIFTWIAFFGLREWKRLQAERNKDGDNVIPARHLVHGMLGLGLLFFAAMGFYAVRFERSMPKEHFAMFRTMGEIKASIQRFDPSGAPSGPVSEFTHEQVVHFQANALDPLLYENVELMSDPGRRVAQITFQQSNVPTTTYNVYPEHIELNGQILGKRMWDAHLPDVLKP